MNLYQPEGHLLMFQHYLFLIPTTILRNLSILKVRRREGTQVISILLDFVHCELRNFQPSASLFLKRFEWNSISLFLANSLLPLFGVYFHNVFGEGIDKFHALDFCPS